MATITQTLPSLCLLGNIPDIIAQVNDNVDLQVQLAGETILEEELIPDSDGNVTVRAREIVASLLSVSIPDTDIFEQNEAAKTFSFIVDGTSINCKVIPGGVNAEIDSETFLKANWLTWQPQQKNVKYNDPEWLSYYAVEAVTVKLKAYFYNGTNEIIDLTTLTAGSVWSLNVMFSYLSSKFETQPVYFDIWTEDAAGTQLAFTQRYVLIADTFEFDDLFVFGNTLGGIDTVRFTGLRSEVPEFEISSAELAESDETVDYYTEPSDNLKKNTGYLPEHRDRQWAKEFMNASLRYYLQDGDLKQITISEFEAELELNNFSTFYYEFTFRVAKRTKYLNLSRSDELPENVTVIDPDSEVFFLAPRLVDFPTASLNSSLLLPIQSPYSEEWEQISYGAIKSNILTAVAALGYVNGNDVSSYVDLTDYYNINNANLPTVDWTAKNMNVPGMYKVNGVQISSQNLSDYSVLARKDGTLQNNLNADLLDGIHGSQFLRRDIAQTVNADTGWNGSLSALNGFSAGLAGVSYLEMLNNLVAVKKDIGSDAYASGFSGNGWRIDPADNRLTVDNLTVRKEMSVYELVINQIRGTNGALWVSDSAKVAGVSGTRLTIDTGGSSTLVPFAVNDLIRCQRWTGNNIKYYVARVTAVGSNYIDVTKTDGTSAFEAGDEIVRIGNTSNAGRQGALYLTASDSNAPYLDVLDGVVSADLTGKTKVRLGKLDGITDANFGALTGYGMYAENVYLNGSASLTGAIKQAAGKWSLNSDGSGRLASGNIIFDAEGNVTFGSGVSLNWTNAANSALSSAKSYAASQASTALSSAKSYADTKKSEAINSASSDATSKANTAQSNAQSYAANAVNTGQIYVRSTGMNRNANRILKISGTTIYDTTGRGIRLTVISRSNLAVVFDQNYDVYGSDSARTDLSSKINSYSSDYIITLSSFDAINWNADLINAVNACGGSGFSTGGRVPYAFMGYKGLNPGTAIEVFTSDDSSAPYAEISTKIIDGNIVGINSGYSNYAQTKASTAQSAAISTAASDATTKANNAKSAAISTAASDATTKANSAKSAAISTAASDATTKANNALSSAKSYTSNALGGASFPKLTKLTSTGVYTGTLTASQVNAAKVTVLGAVTGGSFNLGSGRFKVNANGYLTATGATISGAITATSGSFTGTVNASSGTIGGFSLSSTTLSGTSSSGKIYIKHSTDRFAYLNYSSTILSYFRADGGTAIQIYTEGSSGKGLRINGQTGSHAIESYGNVSLSARSGEELAFTGKIVSASGYFSGFRMYSRRVTSSLTLSDLDNVVLAMPSRNITLTLPSSPKENQIYFIRRCTSHTITMKVGNTSTHKLTYKNTSNGATTLNFSDWATLILIWDNTDRVWWASATKGM